MLDAPRLRGNCNQPHTHGLTQESANLASGERHTVRVGVELGDIRRRELGTTGVNLTGKLGSNLTVTQCLGGRLANTLAVDGLNHLVNGGCDVGHVRPHSVGDNVGDAIRGKSVNELLASDVSHSKFPSVCLN